MKKCAILLLAGGIYALLIPAVFAEDLDKDVRRPAHSADSAEQAAETVEEASLLESVEGPAGITYADILKDPDNIELSYNYAKKQVREGDLKGASATLERILALAPDMSRVRLIYAIVLYRLDNLIEARRELKTLESSLMPDTLRDEIRDYLKRIERRLKRTDISAMLGLGANYDTNRNASPSSGERLFYDVPITLVTGLKEDDASSVVMTRLGATHDLGTQAGHTVFGELSGYRAEQNKVDVLDLQAYSLRAGGGIKTRFGTFTPAGTLGRVLLSERTYLRMHGGDLRWDYSLNQRTKLFALGQSVYQDYVNTRDIPAATERAGWLTGGVAGGNYILNPLMRLTGSLGYFRNDAKKRYNAYDRYELKGAHAWLLGKGCFLLTSLVFHSDKYLKADAVVSRKTVRKDTGLRAAVTLGAPLGFIAKPLKPMLLTVTGERFDSSSNLTNYTYRNNKLGMMLIYKWDFSI